MFGPRHWQIWTELSQKLFFPKWSQDGSRWPRIAQDSLLGAFLGLHRLSWKALDPQKPEKNIWYLKVFANTGFRYFEVIDGPLGLILAPLGRIWSQNGSHNEFPNSSNSILK